MSREVIMKTLLVGSLAIVGVAAATIALPPPAQAQNYPWCAQYSGGKGGATNCGFTTFEQCMETVRGIGGFCEKNNWYHPEAAAPRRSAHTRRRSQS
jgi:hypothetical protein